MDAIKKILKRTDWLRVIILLKILYMSLGLEITFKIYLQVWAETIIVMTLAIVTVLIYSGIKEGGIKNDRFE